MKKLMIASDIHGSAYWCGRLLEAFSRENADRLLLLGDILYHGPRNDLPEGYAPKAVIAQLNPLASCCACAATATAKWIRWCCPSPCWRTMPYCRLGKGCCTQRTVMFTIRIIRPRSRRVISCCMDIHISPRGNRSERKVVSCTSIPARSACLKRAAHTLI